MRIKPSNGQPWICYAKITLQALGCRTQALADKPAIKLLRDGRERDMCRHRDNAQVRAGEHHHGVVFGNAATLCNKLGLAWMRETHRV